MISTVLSPVVCRSLFIYYMFFLFFFFFNDTATTEIYTLSLHDALPIYAFFDGRDTPPRSALGFLHVFQRATARSEEHTSELQSHVNLVCRLLLEKKKNKKYISNYLSRNTVKNRHAATRLYTAHSKTSPI